MDLVVYTLAQPVLNVGFGFVWGLIAQTQPFRRSLWIWALLVVFVSVRVVGDWLFGLPHLPWETLRLYVYATCFFVGLTLAWLLRSIYHSAGRGE